MPFVNPSEWRFDPENRALAMSFVSPEQYHAQQAELQQTTTEAGFFQIMESAFNQSNIGWSYSAKWMNQPGPETEEEQQAFASGEFDVFEVIPPEFKDNPAYVDEYVKYGRNQRMTDWVTNNIRRQEQERQVLDENYVAGMAASFAAVATSPETLPLYIIPGGLALKGSSMAGKLTLSKAVSYEAALGAATAGLGEYALHQTQPTRTVEESMYAIGASVLFSSLLTGAVGLWRGNMADALRIAEDDMLNVDSRPVFDGSAGAMEARDVLPEVLEQRATKTVDNMIHRGELDPAQREFAIAKERQKLTESLSQVKGSPLKQKVLRVMGYASPSVRIATSRMHSARVLGAQLVDDPLTRIRNLYGDSLGPSVEIEIDAFKARAGQAINDILMNNYRTYKINAKKAGQPVWSFEKFADEVGNAHRNGDKSTIKEVADSATTIRSEILTPFEQRLVNEDMLEYNVVGFEDLKPQDILDVVELEAEDLALYFDGDVPRTDIAKELDPEIMDELVRTGKLAKQADVPDGDVSYFHRQYDTAAIDNDIAGFINDIRNILNDEDDLYFNQAVAKKEAAIEKKMNDFSDSGIDWVNAEPRDARTLARLRREIDEANQELPKIRQELREYRDKARPNLEDINEIKVLYTASRDKLKRLRAELNDHPGRVKELEADLVKYRQDWGANAEVRDNINTKAAYTIKNKIMNNDIGLSTKIESFQTGALKERSFKVSSNKIQRWLINNADTVWNDYFDNVAPRLFMKEKFGSYDLQEQLAKIQQDYNEAITAAKSAKEAKALQKDMEKVVRDVTAMRDSLLNQYKIPDNPGGAFSQVGQRLREFNFMTLLGQMTISAMPDVGHIILRHGLRNFSKGLVNLAGAGRGMKLNLRQQKAMGMAIDLTNNSRAMRMGMLDNQYGLMTNADRVMNKMTGTFSKLTLMPQWNAAWKQFTGFIYSNDVLTDAMSLSKGKLNAKKITAYARGGLSADDLRAVADALQAQKEWKIDGVLVANPDEWADQALANRYKNAIFKEVDTTVVTPGIGDLPLASRGEVGRLVFQFKSFAMSANNRIVLASMDDFSAQKFIGMLSMIALGGLSQVVRDAAKGKQTDLSNEKAVRAFIDNAVDRSGLLAYWGDINALIEKATRGKVAIIPQLSEKELDRYASRNLLGALMGPSAGRIADLGQVTGSIANGDYRETDARAMRRLMLFNNLFWSHRAFNKIEQAIGGQEYSPLGTEM